jgi:hypothetical protein
MQKLEELQKNIGKKVVKKSDKPFKSTFKINTIKDVIVFPIAHEIFAYTFLEDNSAVSVDKCKVLK